MRIRNTRKTAGILLQFTITAIALLGILALLLAREKRHQPLGTSKQMDRSLAVHQVAPVSSTPITLTRKQIELLNQKLLMAADAGDEAAVRSLAARGADMRAIANDALMLVCYSSNMVDGTACNPKTVQLLLEHGAGVNDKNEAGDTALILVALSGQEDNAHDANDANAVAIARDLIEHGADAMAKGNGGETALSYARDHNMRRLTQYLLSVEPSTEPPSSTGEAKEPKS